MTQQDAVFAKIKEALEMTKPGISDKVTMETHLIEDDVLDSLDLMNFMYELETLHGQKIEQIDESFDDYRVNIIAGFMSGTVN